MTRRPAMPTTQLSDGEWVQSGLFTHHECCDCGLVHQVSYKLVDGQLWERWTREPKPRMKAAKKAPKRG